MIQTEEVNGGKKEEVLSKSYQLGFEYERDYGNCAQGVIAAIDDIFGLEDIVFKTSFVFSAGYGLSGKGLCGALSAAGMILGYYYGRERENFSDRTNRDAHKMALEIQRKYIEKYGSCICQDVHRNIMGKSFNLWDSDEYQEFEEAGGHRDKCPEVVGTVASWIAECLIEQMNPDVDSKQ